VIYHKDLGPSLEGLEGEEKFSLGEEWGEQTFPAFTPMITASEERVFIMVIMTRPPWCDPPPAGDLW